MKSVFAQVCLVGLLAACGCMSTSVKQPKIVGDSFDLILARHYDGPFQGTWVRLPVTIDGKTAAKIRTGSYVDIKLSPGTHQISSARGHVVARDLPVATTNIMGKAGDRIYLSYVIEYGPSFPSYYVGGWEVHGDMTLVPSRASWKDLSAADFERKYAKAKR